VGQVRRVGKVGKGEERMRMPMRATAVAAIATVVLMSGLLTGVAARRDERVWPTVRPGVALPADLSALVHQTINADGGAAYAIAPDARDPSTFVAANPAQGFDVAFTPEGARIAGASPLTLRLAAFGRGDDRRGVAMAQWRPEGQRIERSGTSDDISEWYINGPLGLEQGFTVPRAPSGQGTIAIELTVSAPWTVLPAADASALRLRLADTNVTLNYAGLHAFDAEHRALPARLSGTGQRIRISVDADAARYPITIDPFIQQQTLTASDGEVGDSFGLAVALGAGTLVVGSPFREDGRGAAYVFDLVPAGQARAERSRPRHLLRTSSCHQR
jgi:hypothetical protein